MSEKNSRILTSIELSPLLRQTEFNLAEDIIRTGLETGNVADYHQQVLGIPSSLATNALSVAHLRASITAPRPVRGHEQVRLAGIDQGRGQHWIYILQFDLQQFWQDKPLQQVILNTPQTVLLARDCVVTEIPDLLAEYSVVFGLIDNEPDISESAELARRTVLELADQKSAQLDDIKKISVQQGGITHPCWGIKNDKFLREVLNSFINTDSDGYPLQRLPEDWDLWFDNPSELSPIRHLLGPKYDTNTNKWIRGEGNIDDLYYACAFAQAAFHIYCTEYRSRSEYIPGLGSVRPVRKRF